MIDILLSVTLVLLYICATSCISASIVCNYDLKKLSDKEKDKIIEDTVKFAENLRKIT